jgi:hypothetical protein
MASAQTTIVIGRAMKSTVCLIVIYDLFILCLGRVGLEPTTNTLKGYCSTIELPTLENIYTSLL